MTTAYDAIVLAGGAARRLGGADKPGVRVGGRALLDRVLAGCRDAGRTVVVAEPRGTARPVEWTREEPPGGGPVAALAAGLRRLAEAPASPRPAGPEPGLADPSDLGETSTSSWTARPARPGLADPSYLGETSTSSWTARPARPGLGGPSDLGDASASSHAARPDTGLGGPAESLAGPASLVLVLSADLPFFDAATARRLVDALVAAPEAEAVVSVDAEGREQPLVAAYRAGALRRELAGAAAERGGLDGLPLRRITGGLRVVRVPAEASASFDCDTWEDIAAARARIREHGNVLDEWITAVKDELGIDLDVDTGLLLDLARDAAHGVARPAAPLTTFLVGYAAARAAAGEGGPEAVKEAAQKAAALAQRWAAEQDETG
ncbi:DUF6457 domain-containing protein [Streptomyces sp. NPDC053431]|uniref:DUF6457 domain-containing protein n=1 Tax=Streptomyces sp. NPDC053431 TaxID=3365703 RepID=UPI0037D631E5